MYSPTLENKIPDESFIGNFFTFFTFKTVEFYWSNDDVAIDEDHAF